MLPSIWTKCMEIILPLDEKSNKEEKEREKYTYKVLNLNNIYNNCNTERNYNRRQTCWDIVLKQGNFREQKKLHSSPPFKRNYTPPLHSKLGCLLFSTGSSNSRTTLHGGDGGGKALYTLLKSVKRNKAPFGRSGSTNFVATLHGGMGKENLYYTLLKSVKRQKAPFGRSVSTNFVAFLLPLLLELIDTLDNLAYINVYIRVATMLCAYYPQLYTFSKCSKRFYILFLILSIYVFFILMF